MKPRVWKTLDLVQQRFLDGADARVITAGGQAALRRLWQHKRGEYCPGDDARDLARELDRTTKDLNRNWYQHRTGRRVLGTRRPIRHGAIPWMVATVDGVVNETGALFTAAFVPTSSVSESELAAKHLVPLQHNMWVTQRRTSVLSIISGDGCWATVTVMIDPLF